MLLALFVFASLVNDVRALVAKHEFADAERAVRTNITRAGATPEAAAALSWLARGEFDSRAYDRADTYAQDARKMAARLLRTRKLDSDPWLPVALGASIEVHSQVLAARGELGEAVTYLRGELASFGATSIGERIQKNLNLLDLEGKPAPPLDSADFLGGRPSSLASLRGHVVLLFFWAHWCPDCKAEAPALIDLLRVYGPQGLVLIGPTRLYGYVEGGKEATAAQERKYIQQVCQQFYPGVSAAGIPMGAANFRAYGASTTPTLVLIDKNGFVRYFHPGAVPESELAARIRTSLGS